MTFTPTHRTTSPIGRIPATAKVQVAYVEHFEYIDDLLNTFGENRDGITVEGEYGNYRILEESNGDVHTLHEDGYLLTDGTHFATTVNDKSFEPITEPTITLIFTMGNGDLFYAPPVTEEKLEESGILDYISHLKDTDYIEVPHGDNAKVVLNPSHISHVEIRHNV